MKPKTLKWLGDVRDKVEKAAEQNHALIQHLARAATTLGADDVLAFREARTEAKAVRESLCDALDLLGRLRDQPTLPAETRLED